MPSCAECVGKDGTLEDGGIWVDIDPGLIGKTKWIKHQWTVDLAGSKYAVGQDPGRGVVAYASLEEAGRALPLWRAASMSIRYALLAVVLSFWAIAGFLFWIPLIVRATVGFCITAIYANLASPNASVPNQGLQHAALFYVNGFRSIIRGVLEPHTNEPSAIPTFRGGRFFVEVLWAALFWWGSLLLLAYLGIAFTAFQDSLIEPVFWAAAQVAAGWSWMIGEMDALIQWGSGLGLGNE